MRILCVGHVTYDITFPCDSFPVENTKTRYHEKENDHCIFKYKYIAAIFFMFNYTRNYNRR